MRQAMHWYKFKALLLETGWLSPAYVCVDHTGIIRYLSNLKPVDSNNIESFSGYALPGFQNAHSHAFQYAMAGKAERNPNVANDDFWSWRETMYRFALSMDPDQLENIATMLYAEMLRKGYTQVAEFHYMHHNKDGTPYNNLAETGDRLIQAAKKSGIKITLIPVFYQRSNFGKAALPQQSRFISRSIDDYFQLLDDSAHAIKSQDYGRLGFGVHSLRAVDDVDIIKTYEQGPSGIPFHLHVAEQKKEVEDCVDYLKMRPSEWLLKNLPVDKRFNLIHCTHLNADETLGLAAAGANVVLCPATEGNLGDGIFSLTTFTRHNGRFCVGTDSQINLNLMEDLRWLDYAQRFTTHKRNTFADNAHVLFRNAMLNGYSANGSTTSQFFTIGESFDAVIYDAECPLIAQADLETLLETILYTSDSSEILGTIVNGVWLVRKGRHQNHEQILSAFVKTMKSLSGIS
jgi:formimidoylglutamate deiminase